MKRLKIYLDASAIGYLDEQSSPKEMNDMLLLWEDIKQGKFEVALSEVTLNEISANQNADKVQVLVQHLSEITFNTIEINEEIEKIAALVKSNGLLISDKHQNDRLHIGCAVVSGCDVLVSYNFKHLANVRIIKGIRGISSLSGYGNIDIMPAAMLLEEGDN
jgi:predicted nucleic acid-binding protein